MADSNVSTTHNPFITRNGWNLTEEQLETAYYNNIVYYSIMVPLAVCGNVFTLTAVIMVLKIKKNIPNLLIGQLACTDLVSILTCHLIAMISMAKGSYVGSANLCYFQSMMSYTYFKMGFFTKCCISLDRFIALAFPLKYRRLVTMKKVVLVTIHNIVFSVGTSVLTLIVDKEHIYQLPTWFMCLNDFQFYTLYKFIVVIVDGAIFTLCVILFFISNITVIKVVLDLNRRRRIKLGRVVSLDVKTKPDGAFKPSADDGNNNTGQLHLSIRSLLRQSSAIVVDPKPNNSRSSIFISTTAMLQVPDSSCTSSECGSTESINKTDKHRKISDNERAKNNKHSKQQRELQLAKLVTIIVSVFVVLWIPYMVSIYSK